MNYHRIQCKIIKNIKVKKERRKKFININIWTIFGQNEII